MGSVSEMKDVSGEKRKAVVLKHFPDKGVVTVVDIKSRKKKTVNVSCLFRCKRPLSRNFFLEQTEKFRKTTIWWQKKIAFV